MRRDKKYRRVGKECLPTRCPFEIWSVCCRPPVKTCFSLFSFHSVNVCCVVLFYACCQRPACSFPSNGFLSSFLASKITSGKPFSSSNKKSINPFFVDSKSSPKASMSLWVSFTFGSSEIFACPFSLSKNRQPACSSSLFIFIRAFASLEFAILLFH